MGISLKKRISIKKMAEMVNPPNKMSLRAIGKKYKVSRQRVHQVLQEYKELSPELFVEYIEPSKKDIKRLLKEGYSLVEIADNLGITTGHLKKKMSDYNIRKRFIKDILTKDILLKLYVNYELDDEKIADSFKCSSNTVMKLRYIYNIHESMRRTLNEKLPKDFFIELYSNIGLTLKQIADLFDTNIQNVIKLKKEYEIGEIIDKKDVKYRASGVSVKEIKKIKQSLIKKR